jgi:hypothetical protein
MRKITPAVIGVFEFSYYVAIIVLLAFACIAGYPGVE